MIAALKMLSLLYYIRCTLINHLRHATDSSSYVLVKLMWLESEARQGFFQEMIKRGSQVVALATPTFLTRSSSVLPLALFSFCSPRQESISSLCRAFVDFLFAASLPSDAKILVMMLATYASCSASVRL